MRETIRVIDLSEWTGPVPAANARRMVEEYNVRGVILQAWGGGGVPGLRNEYFHQAVAAFRSAGITNIDPYVWPPRDWQAALAWIGDARQHMSGAVYLDVEAGAGVNNSIVDGVRRAGWEPRIYASPSSWQGIMGDTTAFAHLKLWIARYLLRFQRADGYYRPGFDVRFPRDAFGGQWTGMGGWTARDLVGWQTTGTVPNFCGESVDSSIFYRDAFREEEDDMASTFDEIMIGLDGQPRRFEVLRADLTWGTKTLTYRAYTLLSSLGLVRDAAHAGFAGRLEAVEAEGHEHGVDEHDQWPEALDAHAANPDAHHA